MSVQYATSEKHTTFSLSKWFRDFRHNAFYRAIYRHGEKVVNMGDPTESCNWTMSLSHLDKTSIVYCAGVGRDISFEHALTQLIGCKIILMDPSPTGLETMALPANQTDRFQFLPIALAASDGELTLAPPLNAREGSWMSATDTSNTITVPARSLKSLMQEFGHSHIDFLKIDIEGAEYSVVDEILQDRLPIKQICVEFHNGVLPGYSRSMTVKSLMRLWFAGYRVIAKEGSNHTLLKFR